MDEKFNAILYNECNYLYMLGFMLHLISKRATGKEAGRNLSVSILVAGLYHFRHNGWYFAHRGEVPCGGMGCNGNPDTGVLIQYLSVYLPTMYIGLDRAFRVSVLTQHSRYVWKPGTNKRWNCCNHIHIYYKSFVKTICLSGILEIRFRKISCDISSTLVNLNHFDISQVLLKGCQTVIIP